MTVLIAADDLAEIALLLRQQISSSPPRWLAINLFLVPASAAIPAATKQQNEDQNNDEKGSGVHVYLRVLYFARAPYDTLQLQSTFRTASCSII